MLKLKTTFLALALAGAATMASERHRLRPG
ncbi:hypothetical protein ACVWZR_010528 [Bradyrhizobium sp. i1.3.1]